MTLRRSPRRGSRPLLALAIALAVLAFPAAAGALQFEIDNQSGRSDVYVTITGSPFDVPGMEADVPKPLDEVPNPLTINQLVSGRIYISYGREIREPELGTLFRSATRFDWAELTVTPDSEDKANLTAIEQSGIGMRLDTYGAGKHLGELGSANSDTIFAALQEIPGGPAATVRNGSEIVRVISPQKAATYSDLAGVYPNLGDYVRSLSGQTISLHTAFYGSPFTTSTYSGTFAPDGSITLTGTSNPPEQAPSQITFGGEQLVKDIETGEGTPNTLEGTIRRDVLSGFSAGFWGGRYGNNAIDFCTVPQTTSQGTWCPKFNRPAFGAARASLSPFPTCEQYAAVIAKYTNTYGNPYSDASGEVQVSIAQPGHEGEVETLKLTVLPDSGDSQPVGEGGDADCGAASSSPSGGGSGGAPSPASAPAAAKAAKVAVLTGLLKRTHLFGHGRLRVAHVACTDACGRIRATVRKGKRILARALVKRAGAKRLVVAHLTRPGRRALRHRRKLKLRLDLWVTPAGRHTTHAHRKLLLIR